MKVQIGAQKRGTRWCLLLVKYLEQLVNVKLKNSIKIGRENQLTLPKLKGKKQRGRAYQLHNKAENITHVMMGEATQMTL